MKVNQEKLLHFDVKRAGPGELSVFCVGPQTLASCTLTDHHNGRVTLLLSPNEAGKHLLHVKFSATHVPGSPFAVNVRSAVACDSSKLRVTGPGIKHGLLHTFCSYFSIDTAEAGFGQLNVTVRGPKGAFRVEMKRCQPKNRTVLCCYNPTECGLYTIHVRWSGVDIPGSPFHVHICQSKDELDSYTRDVGLV